MSRRQTPFFIAALKGFPDSAGVGSFHPLVLNASLSILGMLFFLCPIAKFPTIPTQCGSLPSSDDRGDE